MTRAAWAMLRRILRRDPHGGTRATLDALVKAGYVEADHDGEWARITDAGIAAVAALSERREKTLHRAPPKPRRVPAGERKRPEYLKGGQRFNYSFRVTGPEMAEFERRAREAGQTVSAYLRGRALDDGEGQP